MKFIEPRPFADPDAAARKLMELANAFEPVQDGRIYIEKINGPFIYELKGTPAEYKAGRYSRLCMAHSCPARLRRHVRSWRKPTPHSRCIRRSTD